MARKGSSVTFPIYLNGNDQADVADSESTLRSNTTAISSPRRRGRRLSKEALSLASGVSQLSSEASYNASDAGQLSLTSQQSSARNRRQSLLGMLDDGQTARRAGGQVAVDFNYGRISQWLIATRSDWTLRQLETSSAEELAWAVGRLGHVRLDGQGIARIENLEAAAQATHVTLHNNRITKMENLGALSHLRYLNLANNLIRRAEGLAGLRLLQCLDLSRNQIDLLAPDDLVPSLHLFASAGNPLRDMDSWAWRSLLHSLPLLRHHDGPDSAELQRELVEHVTTQRDHVAKRRQRVSRQRQREFGTALNEHCAGSDDDHVTGTSGHVGLEDHVTLDDRVSWPEASELLANTKQHGPAEAVGAVRVAPVAAEFRSEYGGIGAMRVQERVLAGARKNNQSSRWTREREGERRAERERQSQTMQQLRAASASSLLATASSLSALSSALSSSRRAIALSPATDPLLLPPPAAPPRPAASESRPSSPGLSPRRSLTE